MFIVGSSHAAPDYKDLKKGFNFGLGLNVSVFQFPTQFTGVSKSKIDESATTVGPSFNIGYDTLLSDHFLLGLRVEGMIADTAGMNEHKSKKIVEKISGKTSQIVSSIRAGYVHEYSITTLTMDSYRMIGEYFIEGGIGTGKNHYIKEYSFNDVITESYHDDVKETFSSNVIAVGVNISSASGAFCELKLMQTSFMSNKARFKGEESVNSGTLQPINKTLNDSKPDPVRSVILLIGKHY